jgi:hypothetical protein
VDRRIEVNIQDWFEAVPETGLKPCTIPSPWIDNSSERLVCACAESAGVGLRSKLHIISEPEATAVYALHELILRDLNFGKVSTLCGAEEGTVDLVSYRIKSLSPRLEVEEISVGCSALCGSSLLDRIVERSTLRLTESPT